MWLFVSHSHTVCRFRCYLWVWTVIIFRPVKFIISKYRTNKKPPSTIWWLWKIKFNFAVYCLGHLLVNPCLVLILEPN